MTDPASRHDEFLAAFVARFGDRALTVAQAQCDAAMDGAAEQWERIVQDLKSRRSDES